jgi:hypothetical protein
MSSIVILNRDGKVINTENDVSLYSLEQIIKVSLQLFAVLFVCIGIYFLINNYTFQSSITILNIILNSVEMLITKLFMYIRNSFVISLTLYLILIWIYYYKEENEYIKNYNNSIDTKMNKFNNILILSSSISSKKINLSNLIKNIFIKSNESIIRISNNNDNSNNNNNMFSYIKSNTSLVSVIKIQLYINEVRIIDQNDTSILDKGLNICH